ncbi:MAG: helicase [Candidatus Omnitrophota bacterium]|jgi:DNA excision repair protein ERCC-3|nr:MAG: helicase [Candidatus Omnitrophota bacterium]
MSTEKPVIVQSDKTIYLEVESSVFEEARDVLCSFAELEKCPEHIHTYRISPLSLWNAASAGITAEDVLQGLQRFSRYPIPGNVEADIHEYMNRYGRLVLEREGENLVLRSDDSFLLEEISRHKKTSHYVEERLDERTLKVGGGYRGHLKQDLIRIGFPVKDLAGYVEGTPFGISLRSVTRSDHSFALRDYQRSAVSAFYRDGSSAGGSGVVVLPCGAGKTVIGLGTMDAVKRHTLILVTNIVALRQWKREILDKTDLDDNMVCEYSGEYKKIGPVTIATYQILTTRKKKTDEFPHLKIFEAQDWGLIIYDEVHLLPAPVFRITADIQARRRIGLTATLVREDGLEGDVFSLIGPKCYDVPWKVLEKQGWIATAECHEMRVSLPMEQRREYVMSPTRTQFRIASENPAKLEVLDYLLDQHPHERILIIGQYLHQLRVVSAALKIPLITGQTPNSERESLYESFRNGEIKRLVVSKVANFAIDLPEATIAVQISGTFGSRQEEAQRLGRILRPKEDGRSAHFYSIITRDSSECEFAQKRQRFLAEQGYRYSICNMEELQTSTGLAALSVREFSS